MRRRSEQRSNKKLKRQEVKCRFVEIICMAHDSDEARLLACGLVILLYRNLGAKCVFEFQNFLWTHYLNLKRHS